MFSLEYIILKCVVVLSVDFFKSMLLCYHWNVFDVYVQMMSDDL